MIGKIIVVGVSAVCLIGMTSTLTTDKQKELEFKERSVVSIVSQEVPKLKDYETSMEIYSLEESSNDISSVSEVEEIVEEEKTEPVVSYTEEEVRMMECIIQQEVRGATLKHKRIIANVILNRVKSEKFPDTISKVILQKNQFSSVGNYYNCKYEPDDDTITAVREVLNGECEDLSNGALFFYSPRWASKSAASYFENNLEFLFELEGHRFFK